MLSKNKNLLALAAISLPLMTASVHAGGMGPVCPEKLFLVEAGVDYMHAFYKSSVKGADSYSIYNPNGRTYDPSSIYPNDFFGGYFGASFMFNNFLLNSRYEMYQSKTKGYKNDSVKTTLAPVKLAFTLDKLWDAQANLKWGLGAGVMISTHNKAEIFDYDLNANQTQIGYSFPGRTRLDPMIEGLLMYQVSDSVRIKGNVSYQIPLNSFYHSGHLGVNLGVNYALPMC